MLNTVLTGDIRQTLDHFRRSVDQLFDNFYGYPAEAQGTANRDWTFSPAIESAWNQDYLLLRAILPGVSEKDVKVSIQNNQLIIEGERQAPEAFNENAFRQLAYGKFYTAVTLPNGLNLEQLTCRLHDGVLDMQVPVAETMKPRQVQIQTGEERKAIGA